ncbi:MAG: hypothetical protein RLZ94_834, partial [Actinomycetota bacterium]
MAKLAVRPTTAPAAAEGHATAAGRGGAPSRDGDR